MKLIQILKKPNYFFLAIVSGIAIILLYVYTQVGNLNDISLWINRLQYTQASLLIIFTILFGITFSYQIHTLKESKTCSRKKKVKGLGTHTIGTLGIFLVAQCPACTSIGFFLLPASALAVITEYNWAFNIIGICILIFTLHYLGAFEKSNL